MMTPFEFLSLLFSSKPDAHKILLWSLPDRNSFWMPDLNESRINKYVANKISCDIYFGLGTTETTFGMKKRAGKADVRGIPGLWLDVDLAGPAHVQSKLPKTKEDVDRILGPISYIMEPSLIVDSGHGLHYYWLFKEYLEFKQTESAEIAALSDSFQAAIQAVFKHAGLYLDKTQDLSRVLRLPGTHNYKIKEHPKRVEAIHQSSNRYSINDFQELINSISGDDANQSSTKVVHMTPTSHNPSGLIFDSGAQPNGHKFYVACNNHDKFRDTFEKKRTDLTDNSNSGYEFSLAIYGAMFGWSDQEIVNLIMMFHSHHNTGLDVQEKERRILYSIEKAKQKVSQEKEKKTRDSIPIESLEDKPSEIEDKDVIREQVKRELGGIGVITLEKYGVDDDPYYTVVLEGDKRVSIGSIECLLSQSIFRAKIAGATDILIKMKTRGNWDKFCVLLFKLLEVIDTGSDWKTRAAERFDEYFGGLESLSLLYKNKEAAVRNKTPLLDDGKLYVHVPSMLRSLNLSHDKKLTNNRLRSELRRIGFSPTRLSVEGEDGKRVQARYYVIDKRVFDEFTLDVL